MVDPRMVIESLDVSPQDVIIGGASACFTVTGLRISNTRDALVIFEACRQGILPRVVRRLNEGEKQQISTGTVVVFDEKEAKMKRWTDGRLWTPSRIMNNFLVYRELDRKLPPNEEGLAEISRWANSSAPSTYPAGAHSSNKGVFLHKAHGLLKTTISLSVPDDDEEFLRQGDWRPMRVHQQHLISYFRPETTAQLPIPDDMEELQGLRLPLPILRIQRFRRPVKVEMFDNSYYDIYDTEEEEPGSPSTRAQGKSTRQSAQGSADALIDSPMPIAAGASGGYLAEHGASHSMAGSLLAHGEAPGPLYGGSSVQSPVPPLHQRASIHLPSLSEHPQQPCPAVLSSSSITHYQLGNAHAFGYAHAILPSPLVLQPPDAVAPPPCNAHNRPCSAEECGSTDIPAPSLPIHESDERARIHAVRAAIAEVEAQTLCQSPTTFDSVFPSMAHFAATQPMELFHPQVTMPSAQNDYPDSADEHTPGT
ncbi:Global transcription regulator sge1 [Coemansia biformis]|uniref:Global transcription regulator sge1 n=1 Tax=Coemansia biformis TaxID=1286918 RepID=A0A9W7YBD0_9FUNG|nr:Global transcription regulator sge1 [Coemansia biformis]